MRKRMRMKSLAALTIEVCHYSDTAGQVSAATAAPESNSASITARPLLERSRTGR
jgi:hypothetical protein